MQRSRTQAGKSAARTGPGWARICSNRPALPGQAGWSFSCSGARPDNTGASGAPSPVSRSRLALMRRIAALRAAAEAPGAPILPSRVVEPRRGSSRSKSRAHCGPYGRGGEEWLKINQDYIKNPISTHKINERLLMIRARMCLLGGTRCAAAGSRRLGSRVAAAGLSGVTADPDASPLKVDGCARSICSETTSATRHKPG